MLKPDVTENQIKIYELYLQRIIHEGNLFWQRFNIFWTLNSALVAIIVFLVSQYLSGKLRTLLPNTILLLTFAIIITFGLIFSFSWYLIIENGKKWNEFISNILGIVEKSIFEDNNCALYQQINSNKKGRKKNILDIDIMDTSRRLALVFFIIWLIFLVCFCYLILNPSLLTQIVNPSSCGV